MRLYIFANHCQWSLDCHHCPFTKLYPINLSHVVHLQLEEAEWIGLSWAQAIEKNHESTYKQSEPLKVKYINDLVKKLEG